MKSKINLKTRWMVKMAYLLGIPALYIILTGNSKDEYLQGHAKQAFYYWAGYLLIFFGLRLLVNLVWNLSGLYQLTYLEALAGLLLLLHAVSKAAYAA